jgi:hypothetical protein
MYAKAGFLEAYDGLSEYFSIVKLEEIQDDYTGYELRDITAVIIDPEKFQAGCNKAAMKITEVDAYVKAEASENYRGDCEIKGNQCLGHTKPGAVTRSYSNSIADDNNLEACLDNSNMKFLSYSNLVDGHGVYVADFALGQGYVRELMDKKFPELKANILTWLVSLLEDELKVKNTATITLGPMGKKLPWYINKVI